MQIPPCPQCKSAYVYAEQSLFICPECAYEWNEQERADDLSQVNEIKVNDANGAHLCEGDKVTLIKDLKVKGSSQALKIGTKALVRRIKASKDHQLDCKVDGAGEMMITAKFVKKS